MEAVLVRAWSSVTRSETVALDGPSRPAAEKIGVAPVSLPRVAPAPVSP